MKTFWQISDMTNYHPTRFTCAECGYDAMIGEPDRGTWRYDCAFCDWGCYQDRLGWWHQETFQEWEQEAYEELCCDFAWQKM